jgi:precorrin-6B methylase 2
MDAAGIWSRFAGLPGATVDGAVGIASAHAIDGLIRAMERFRPSRILEVGAGIGTLTFAILDAADRLGLGARVVTVETHPFCLEQLGRNLARFGGRYELVADTRGAGGPFDLVVIDGGGDLPGDMRRMDLGGLVARGGVVFVEGGRAGQRAEILRAYAGRPIACGKVEALRARLVAPGGVVAENKPYHLFVFEPRLLDRARVRLTSEASKLVARVARRVRLP